MPKKEGKRHFSSRFPSFFGYDVFCLFYNNFLSACDTVGSDAENVYAGSGAVGAEQGVFAVYGNRGGKGACEAVELGLDSRCPGGEDVELSGRNLIDENFALGIDIVHAAGGRK